MKQRYGWAAWGDVNAFFGLMLDNVAVMVILVGTICSDTPLEKQQGYYSFTREFVLTHMIPGTALGVLLGDLVYTWMAFRLARRTGKSDVTAMPLGLDTPSTFGVALLVLAPALNAKAGALRGTGSALSVQDHETAMLFAWHVGLAVLILIGVIKVLFAPLGNAVRRLVPRAGLLGSLAAAALVLIAFLPLLFEIGAVPLVGLLALAVILVTLLAHRALPGHFPGALAAVLVGLAVYYLCAGVQARLGMALVPPVRDSGPMAAWHPLGMLPDFGRGWQWWGEVWGTVLTTYLPVALPFALLTIVGGIDCTESAAAAGDEYDTRTILLTEGAASVAAGLLGGVIQTTPYIGHPAYKAMGGRAAYTLATALFIGLAGYFGFFTHLFAWLPKAAMYPILVFVGVEITSQSFRATPARHYPALALAVLPVLAYLVTLPLGRALGGRPPDPRPETVVMVQTLYCLANGFIVTSLLWAASLAALLDGKYVRSAIYLGVCAVCSLFGIIHCPLPDAAINLPDRLLGAVQEPFKAAVQYQTPYHWAAAYVLAAGLLLLLPLLPGRQAKSADAAEH
jgi:AGZA family xanthine/uracil permease-like MFS transporter